MNTPSNLLHSADNPLEKIQGSIERVTFHSESSGFCVLRVKVKAHRELITVIGSAASVTASEYVECLGIWINDRQHGQQFKSISIKRGTGSEIAPPGTPSWPLWDVFGAAMAPVFGGGGGCSMGCLFATSAWNWALVKLEGGYWLC